MGADICMKINSAMRLFIKTLLRANKR